MTRRGVAATVLAVGAVAAASTATAEIIASEPEGFLVRHVTTVDLPPDAAYRTMTAEIHRWWNPAHSWSGDANNLRIDARAGGCWCETWTVDGKAQSVQHMQVTAARPGALFRASGGLGPLQQLAVAGSQSWTFEPSAPTSTTVTIEYAVSGWTPDGLEGWAGPVDFVIGEQVGRYTRLINTGSADSE